MSLQVFTVEYHGSPLDHKAIMVKAGEEVAGTLYHVRGTFS